MAVIHKSLVKETTTNKPNAATAFNINASATGADGVRNIAAAYTVNDQLPYFATDNAGLWESGIGTYTAGILTRTTILESSNADAAVDFSAGADVELFVEWPAQTAQYSNKMNDSGLTIITGDGSGTGQQLASGVWSKITDCNTVVSNPKAWWDTTNTYFKPTRPGAYLISAACILGASTLKLDDGSKVIVSLYKNGSADKTLARAHASATDATTGFSGMSHIEMNGTTDYVELYAHHNSAASVQIYDLASYLYFTAQWVSE